MEDSSFDLVTLGTAVDWPEHSAAEELRGRLAGDIDLGGLAGLAEWAAQVLPASSGGGFRSVRLLVEGSGPDDALVAELADRAGAQVRHIMDVPTGCPEAVAAGVAAADAEIDAGADLLVVAVARLTSASALVVSVLTNTEPVKVLSRGAAATDPDAWMQRAVDVRDARRRCMPLRDEPDRLLAAIDDADLAFAAALLLRAAGRRTPVLVDGPAASAAALLAYEAAPRAVRWWAAADIGPDPAQAIALSRLGLRSVLGLGSGRGDGLAALLALPALQAAARLAA